MTRMASPVCTAVTITVDERGRGRLGEPVDDPARHRRAQLRRRRATLTAAVTGAKWQWSRNDTAAGDLHAHRRCNLGDLHAQDRVCPGQIPATRGCDRGGDGKRRGRCSSARRSCTVTKPQPKDVRRLMTTLRTSRRVDCRASERDGHGDLRLTRCGRTARSEQPTGVCLPVNDESRSWRTRRAMSGDPVTADRPRRRLHRLRHHWRRRHGRVRHQPDERPDQRLATARCWTSRAPRPPTRSS